MPDQGPGGSADSLRALLDRSLGGAYRLDRELGGGGMSRVFLADECALGRQVVVKVLAPELTHDLSAERFAREIRVSARLQHPNIVSVLTAGTAADLPYYTMPFIEGESLRSRLARLVPGERIPLAEALSVLRDVARALAYAHGHGVIHRDIKPENILLGQDTAMVADFGIAKAMAAARTQGPVSSGVTLTQGGMALGTPAYMSPEQAAGDPVLDQRTDLYAWGVLAYELLAGAHPFAKHHSVQALVTAHLAEQPRPLDEVAPHLPGAVRAIVMRCLGKSPDSRPSSAREILDVLADMDTGQPRGAVGATAPSGRMGPRRGSLVAGLIALALLGAAAAGLAWLGRGPAPDATARPPRASLASAGSDAYLRGRVRVSSENRQDNEAAIEALRQAIAADPGLAPAHAVLARAFAIKAFYFAPDSEKKVLIEDAEVALAKALSLDPDLAEAHFARGLMLWSPGRRFPHEQAVQAYRQALALDSTLDEARHQLALVYLHVGMFDEAEAELDRALTINPSNTLARFRYGVIALYRGDFERAHAVFNSTPLERNPTLWAFQMGTALFRLGREDEATGLIDRFLRDYPQDEGGVGYSVRAMLLAKAGRRVEAEAAIARAVELGSSFGHFHHSAYNIASAYALLGEREQAIRWLQDAADNGFPCYPLFAEDAQLNGLRGDRRFGTLLAGLQRDWERRKRAL